MERFTVLKAAGTLLVGQRIPALLLDLYGI
jgi:hypothetical protein